MSGISLAIMTAALLIHGVLRDASQGRRFLEEERGSARLARRLRDDVHAAAAIAPAADGAIVSLALPDGATITYRLAPDGRGIERTARPAAGAASREDYRFSGACEAAVTLEGGAVRFRLGAPGHAPGTDPPPPATPGEARRKPPAVEIVARFGSDLRFATPRGGEAAR
jgi:hypothetical protein